MPYVFNPFTGSLDNAPSTNKGDSAYTTVRVNSATNWNYQGTDIKALTAGWVGGNDAYTNLVANSAAYLSAVDISFLSVSGNWNSVYSTVNSNSATTWNYQGTDIKSLTANWQSTYTTVSSNSATWNNKTTLSTVVDYLSTNNVILSSAQIGGTASTTLYVRSQKIGINTESPNHALTVVGNISATGLFYGDGSQLTGIVAGDTEATTLVRSNSANWNLAPSVYTTVQTNSATNWNYQGTDLKALSANWQSTYTTVQTNSATWGGSGSGGSNAYLPLSGGNLTGNVTTTAVISSTNVIYASGSRVVTGDSADTTPVYKIRALTQLEYNALGVYDDNTIYFIKQ
jgi:hypothetical protein